MAKKESIKEYGTDLLTQLRDLEKQQRTLRNKVIKRFKFMLDQHPDDPYLSGFTKEGAKEYNTDTMIFVIIRLEATYVDQTKQLDMFNQIDKSNDWTLERLSNIQIDHRHGSINDISHMGILVLDQEQW